MGTAEALKGACHRGDVCSLQCDALGPGFGGRSACQSAVLHYAQLATPDPVPSLAPGDTDHPGSDPRFAPEASRSTPDNEHRVLQDLLGKGSLGDDEEDLTQYDLAVAFVQLSQGSFITGCHSAQRLGVFLFPVGRAVIAGTGREVRSPARYRPLGSLSHDQVSSN